MTSSDSDRQAYLEELWSSSDPSRVILFYSKISGPGEIAKFSLGRPSERLKIFHTGRKDAPVQFVIPTMNHENDFCRSLIENYSGSGLVFVESSGPYFNYARSVNAGIRYALNKSNPETVVISNDDVVVLSSGEDLLRLSRMHGDSAVLCLNSDINGYSGEAFRVFRAGIPVIIKEGIDLKLKNYRTASVLVRLLAARKIAYSVSLIGRFLAGRALSKVSRPITPKLTNFADFGIFPAKVVEKFQFDEAFINGWEDWDMVYRLSRSGIRVERADLQYRRTGHASFAQITTMEMEYIRSYLNRVYFSYKWDRLNSV